MNSVSITGQRGRFGDVIHRVVPLLATLVVLSASVASCSSETEPLEATTATSDGTATSAATPDTVTGLVPYESDTFTISIPQGWEAVATSDPQAQQGVDRMLAENPHIASVVGDATSLEDSNIEMLAVDPVDGSVLSVITQSAPGAPERPTVTELEEVTPSLVTQFESIGATITDTDVVDVGERKAVRLGFEMPLTTDGVRAAQSGWVYVVPSADTMHVVTVLGDASIAEEMIATLTIL